MILFTEGARSLTPILFRFTLTILEQKKTPKKAIFLSCNFCHFWQAVQLEMNVCTIVTLGGVLQILRKVTFVHVGGRRKY